VRKAHLPSWDYASTISAPKLFDIKILPSSDCVPGIIFQFLANAKIPMDQGGGGGHQSANFPKLKSAATKTPQPEYF
jgi:hypothetical protein